jgi:SAM-dependent methyltransferase
MKMIISKLFDFPFSIPSINNYLDFYGRKIQNEISTNLSIEDIDSGLLDIGAGSQKYRPIVENLLIKYTSCDLPGSPNEKSQDFLCDASKLPFKSNSYEFCLHIQVLEHLYLPQISIDEVMRVLKPGGKLLLSTNFLYPIHGEPHDYYRFTKYGLEDLIKNSGLRLESIIEIGGLFKFFSTGLQYQRDFLFSSKLLSQKRLLFRALITPFRLLLNLGLTVVIVFLNQIDKLIYLPKFTSGYFVVAIKP